MGLFGRGPAIAEMDPQQAADAIKDGGLLVDVREVDEWRMGHAAGATHIPLAYLRSKMGTLPADKRIFCICASGARSRSAAEMLFQAGRSDVVNIKGGTFGWMRAGLPMEK